MTEGIVRTTDIILSLVIWISFWQLAILLTEKLSKSVQIAIWILISVIALVLIYRSCCHKADTEKKGQKVDDDEDAFA